MVEVITSLRRRRQWSAQPKKTMVEDAEHPGNSIWSGARTLISIRTNFVDGGALCMRVRWSLKATQNKS